MHHHQRLCKLAEVYALGTRQMMKAGYQFAPLPTMLLCIHRLLLLYGRSKYILSMTQVHAQARAVMAVVTPESFSTHMSALPALMSVLVVACQPLVHYQT